jgi:predicted small integral membrane protein
MIEPPLPSVAEEAAPPPAESAGVAAPVIHPGRQGFLPIPTNTFDRVFISVVCFVALHLLWMRFVEHWLPLTVATVISLVIGFIIARWG